MEFTNVKLVAVLSDNNLGYINSRKNKCILVLTGQNHTTSDSHETRERLHTTREK